MTNVVGAFTPVPRHTAVSANSAQNAVLSSASNARKTRSTVWALPTNVMELGLAEPHASQQGHDTEPQGKKREVMLHATKLQMRRIFAAATGGPSTVVKHGPVVQGIE